MRRAAQRGAANLIARGPLQPAGQRPPAQMKAQPAIRPPHGSANVVQRVVVIKQFGDTNEQRTFTVKRSNSDKSYNKSTDFLIKSLRKVGFKTGWKGHLRKMVAARHPIPDYEYNTLQDLINALAVTFPLQDQNKKRKREEKNEILNQHKTNQQNINSKYSKEGKKMRGGSLVSMNKLMNELMKTKALEQNIDDLTGTFELTKGGGKSLKLDTGNIFQSQFALSQAFLDDDVKGAYLEGNYVRVNDGLGNSEGIRKKPFTELSTRLKRTVVYGEGAYKPGETVRPELSTFENIRLGENSVPSEMRHMLVEEGSLSGTEEFNPIGKFALSEIPRATKGESLNNQLMDQNSFRIFEKVKKLDDSKVIGRNHKHLPKKKKSSTISSYTKSFNEVTTNHTKETQNAFHVEGFRIVRDTYGPFFDENKNEFWPNTPPGSPFNQDYEYDK